MATGDAWNGNEQFCVAGTPRGHRSCVCGIDAQARQHLSATLTTREEPEPAPAAEYARPGSASEALVEFSTTPANASLRLHITSHDSFLRWPDTRAYYAVSSAKHAPLERDLLLDRPIIEGYLMPNYQTAPKILIAFYSRTGVTEALANGVAAGAREAGGEVRIRRVREFVSNEVMERSTGWREAADGMNAQYEAPTEEDAEWADAIIFGSPSRFGSPAAELKAFIDSLGGLWFQGRLNGKAASAFATSSTTHGGNEATILSLYAPAAHLGMIIVPTGYADPTLFEAGTPYGASSISQNLGIMPTATDLAVASYQGRRVTEVAGKLRGTAA
jgi:NAD(P)H dehydrogenase (quinone)